MQERVGKEALGEIVVFEQEDRVGGRKYRMSRDHFRTGGNGQDRRLSIRMEMRAFDRKSWAQVSLYEPIGTS